MTYSPMVIIANVPLMMSSIATKQSLKNTPNLLIFCMNASDSVIGAILLPVLGFEHIWYDDARTCTLRQVSLAINFAFGGNSIGMTILLAIDRYIHTNPDFHRSPSRFAKCFERPRIYYVIFSTSLFFVSQSVAAVCVMQYKRIYGFYFMGFNAFFTMVATTVFVAIYMRGYLRIRRSVAENPIYADRGESNSQESPEYLRQLFKTVLLLLITMLATWLPVTVYTILLTIAVFGRLEFVKSDAFYVFSKTTLLFFYLNPILNALIILYRNKKSKEWVMAKLASICRKRRNEGGDVVVMSNIGTIQTSQISV